MSLLLPGVAPTDNWSPDMDSDWLSQEVWAKGFDCTWQLMAVCPCARKTSDPGADFAASLSFTPQGPCLACGGRGRVYHSSQTIRAQFLGATGRLDLDRIFGLGQPGSVRITTLPEHPIGEGDRVTIDTAIIARRYTEVHIRATSGLTDTLRFPVWPQTYTISNGAGGSTTRTASAFYVIATDANGTIIGGATPTEYVIDVDFTVASGSQTFTWITGRGPAAGAHFSVSYFCKASYIVTAQPFLHRAVGNMDASTVSAQTWTRLLNSASAVLEDATQTGGVGP